MRSAGVGSFALADTVFSTRVFRVLMAIAHLRRTVGCLVETPDDWLGSHLRQLEENGLQKRHTNVSRVWPDRESAIIPTPGSACNRLASISARVFKTAAVRTPQRLHPSDSTPESRVRAAGVFFPISFGPLPQPQGSRPLGN